MSCERLALKLLHFSSALFTAHKAEIDEANIRTDPGFSSRFNPQPHGLAPTVRINVYEYLNYYATSKCYYIIKHKSQSCFSMQMQTHKNKRVDIIQMYVISVA